MILILYVRHWIFQTQKSQVVIPKFLPGVVGRSPTIQPNESFTYMSYAPLDAKNGSMEGAFLFKNEQEGEFEIPIEKCDLKEEVY